MNWAALLALAMARPVTIPTPPLYQDAHVVVTLRPALDLDLNYVGLSLQVRLKVP